MNSPPTLEVALLAGDGVLEPHAGHRAVAVDVDDLAVPGPAHLRVLLGALDHDLAGAQRVAAVHDRHGVREAGQEGGFLHRGVAAADDGDVLVAEEEAVTGRTPGHAVPGQLVLAGQPELAVGRTHRQDHRVCGVLAVVGADHLDRAAQVDLGDVVADQLGAEALGLGADVVSSAPGRGCPPGSPGSSRRRWCSSARRRTASPRTRAARGRRVRCTTPRCNRPGRNPR